MTTLEQSAAPCQTIQPAVPTPAASAPGSPTPPSSPRLCRFLSTCPTYNDSLIPYFLKGRAALGCLGATDAHRQTHCRTFACMLLAESMSGAGSGRARDAASLRA